MKRILAVFCTVLVVFALFIGCTESRTLVCGARKTEAASGFTAERLNSELETFVGSDESGNRNRTSFSEHEKKAAAYIKERLISFGYEADKTVSVQEFTAETQGNMLSGTHTFHSQNVIAEYNPGKEKRVVIGAHYDNLYSAIEQLLLPGSSDEAIANGASGVSVLLVLAEELMKNQPATDFTVTMVFYGASEVGYVGSARFLSDWLNVSTDVALTINLKELSGECVTVYSDEVKTNHGTLFLDNGAKYQTDFVEYPKSIPLSNEPFATNIGYSHHAMTGDHVYLFEKGVPTVNFTGGNLSGFVYYQRQTDSLESYRADNPNGGIVMADTASLIYEILTWDGLKAASESFTQKYDYSFVMNYTAANLILMGFIIVLGVVLVLVVKLLSKKYPKMPHMIKKVKLAVFGMEYENNADNEICVDLVPVDEVSEGKKPDDDPFDGENQ